MEQDARDDSLLIAPDPLRVDLFSRPSQVLFCYCNIEDHFTQEVNDIRKTLLSTNSCESVSSNSLEYSSDSLQRMENVRQSLRKYNSTESLHDTILIQDSPPRRFTKSKLNVLPNRHLNNMNSGDDLILKELLHGSSPRIDPRKMKQLKKENKTISEIDTFLSKVKTIQRINESRRLKNQNEFKRCETKNDQTEPFDQLNKPTCKLKTDNTKLFKSLTNIKKTPSCQQRRSEAGTHHADNSHGSSANTIHPHKQYLNDSEKESKTKTSSVNNKQRSKHTIVGDNFGPQLSLMSLANLWDSNYYSLSKNRLIQKLQEEESRREHCEELIKDLQKINLELQEKISVALRVDEKKTVTIKKYQDTLEKLIFKLENINNGKIDQEFEINRLNKQFVSDKENSADKFPRYEKEIKKILGLARTSQEKSATWEHRCSELLTETQTLTTKLKSLEQDNLVECEKNRKMSDKLHEKEIELSESKRGLTTVQSEILEYRHTSDMYQSELEIVKDKYINIENLFKAEKQLTAELNKKISELTENIEFYRNQQILLQEEIDKRNEQLECNKNDLKKLYQGQVELLVQSKLKEFQYQLEETENNFKKEVKKREMIIASSASNQIQEIAERYSQAIKLLVKKQQEERLRYQTQIGQYKRQAEELQQELDVYRSKQTAITEQLQKAAESQWNQALRIISNRKKCFCTEESASSTADQINSLKTKYFREISPRIEVTNNQPNDTDSTKEKEVFNKIVQSFENISNKAPTRAFSKSDIHKYLSLGFSYAFLILSQLPKVLKQILLVL